MTDDLSVPRALSIFSAPIGFREHEFRHCAESETEPPPTSSSRDAQAQIRVMSFCLLLTQD